MNTIPPTFIIDRFAEAEDGAGQILSEEAPFKLSQRVDCLCRTLAIAYKNRVDYSSANLFLFTGVGKVY